jgi:hypothetical protein
MLKLVYVVLFLQYSTSFATVASDGNLFPVQISNYYSAGKRPNDTNTSCRPPHCFGLDELIKFTLSQGFASREKAEQVYRARLEINKKLSGLLPSLNIGRVVGAVQGNMFEVVSGCVGFIFPSRWFKWQESKKYAKAEVMSYKTLLANQVNMMETLYFNIHTYLINRDILAHYHGLLARIITYLERQKALLSRPVSDEHLGFLHTVQARIGAKLVGVQSLLDSLTADLAALFVFEGDWKLLEIARLDLPGIEISAAPHPDTLWHLVESHSSELKGIEYMVGAAEKSLKARYFDFFDPNGGNLGFSYVSDLKIGKSELTSVAIQKEKIQTNLRLALTQALNNQGTAISYYHNGWDQALSLQAVGKNLEDHIASYDPLELAKFSRFIDNAIEADMQINTSMHLFQITVNSLRRLLWQGHFYEQIIALEHDRKPPPFLSKRWFEDRVADDEEVSTEN